MNRTGIAFGILSLLWMTEAAHADHYREYFPLQTGNRWNFTQALRATPPLQVAFEQSGMFRLTGFPGAEDRLWVSWVGNSLYAYDGNQTRWEPLFKFGAAVGTRYAADLGPLLLSNLEITVADKTLRFTHHEWRQDFSNCIQFDVRSPFSNIGLMKFVFAPRIGLMLYVEGTTNGFHWPTLRSGFVNGHPLGLLPFTELEGGSDSRFPFHRSHSQLINDPVAWQVFYGQHRPGAVAPTVDFTSKTVLVVVLDRRATTGNTFPLRKVRWDYPWDGVTAFLQGTRAVNLTDAAGPANPYRIVLLDQKVTGLLRLLWLH